MVLKYQSEVQSVTLFNDAFISAYHPDRIEEGRWFSEEDSGTPCAVLVGEMWDARSIGDTLSFDNGLSVKIIGKIPEEALLPAYHGTVNEAEDLFSKAHSVILNGDSVNWSRYDSIRTVRLPYFFILLNSDATDAEKQEFLDYLSEYGDYTEYGEIVKNTDESIHRWMIAHLPFPGFILVIITVCFFSICFVVMKQSLNEQAKYMLMGCSRRRSVGTVVSAFSIVFGGPALCAFIIGANFRDILLMMGKKEAQLQYLVNADCLIPTGLYLIFLFSVIVLMPILFYAKNSPMDIYIREL